MEDVAAAISAAFGSQMVSAELATTLRELLPNALYLRASVRCGMGLFVTEDLLQSAQGELSVASLKNSLAGIAMAQRCPVVVAAPASQTAPTIAQVLCVPVAVPPASMTGNVDASADHTSGAAAAAAERPLFVGSLMVGSAAVRGPPPLLWDRLEALAAATAPYFLLLGLTKAAEMAGVLRLQAADCSCCAEDELQDLPLEACRPPLLPHGEGGPGADAKATAGDDASWATDTEQAKALHAAAAAALEQQSGLPGAGYAPATASANISDDNAAGSSTSSLKCAMPQRPLPPHRDKGMQDSDDPKAALKRRQAPATAAAPPPPTGILLRYADTRLEARFTAIHNASLRGGDALFALMHLAAALCFALLHPAAVLASGTVQAFVAVLIAPLALMALDENRYSRHREALLALLLLAHALVLRWNSLPPLLGLLPPHVYKALPWLLHSTGAEALAVFSIGFKLRFCLFLPLQALCVTIIMSALSEPCQATLVPQAAVCMPLGLGRGGMALLLALGSALLAAAVHNFEVRARRRFQQALPVER